MTNATIEEPSDKLVTMPILTSIDVGDIHEKFLRDETLETVSDVLLWVSSARISSGSGIGFSIALFDPNKWRYSLKDISAIKIDGICNSFTIYFNNCKMWSISFDDTQYACDSIVFHKGDFLIMKNRGEIASVPAVY